MKDIFLMLIFKVNLTESKNVFLALQKYVLIKNVLMTE